jgi:hypothetical protein
MPREASSSPKLGGSGRVFCSFLAAGGQQTQEMVQSMMVGTRTDLLSFAGRAIVGAAAAAAADVDGAAGGTDCNRVENRKT